MNWTASFSGLVRGTPGTREDVGIAVIAAGVLECSREAAALQGASRKFNP
jgi:hypothetical protein